MPMNLCKPSLSCGVGICLTSSIFAGSGRIPVEEYTSPKKLILSVLMTYLVLLKTKPSLATSIRFKRFLSCSSSVLPNTAMSSVMPTHPGALS